jgi:predicted SnoaL-like aldol condensation-catalyzing enzyme
MKGLKTAIAGVCAAVGLVSAFPAGAETAQEQANKQHVIEFYNKALNDKDFDAASKYLGDRYTQHNPTADDGPAGLKAFIDFLKTKFPQQHNEIVRAFADGDYVILHVHSVRTPGTAGRAIVDIFKLDHGKVVEHWDVIEDVPASSANSNGMF